MKHVSRTPFTGSPPPPRRLTPARALILAAAGAAATAAHAQTLDLNAGVLNGRSESLTSRAGCGPPIDGFCNVIVDATPGGIGPLPFNPGFLGRDFGQFVNTGCGLNIFLCPLRANSFGVVFVDNADPRTVVVDYRVYAGTHVNCVDCPDYLGFAEVKPLLADLSLQVNGGPPGPIPLYFDWEARSSAFSESEGGADDLAGVTGTRLDLDGAPLYLPGALDLPPAPTINTAASALGGGTVNVLDATPFAVALAGETVAEIIPPPFSLAVDRSFGWHSGRLVLSIDPIPPGGPGGALACSPADLFFSVDIAGDAELSDPSPDGNEWLDPGDLYRWFGPAFGAPANGADDDAILLGTGADPAPTPFGPAAPACAGVPVAPADFFDLDGADRLSFALDRFVDSDAPLDARLTRNQLGDTPCAHPAIDIQISYDDDLPAPYFGSAAGGPCDVPVLSPSPLGFRTYGTSIGFDELTALVVLPTGFPATLGFSTPLIDEETLHGSLAPNPVPFDDSRDDDTDALDALPRTSDPDADPCPFRYFSADHEATFGLDPGDVYRTIPGGIVRVIDNTTHLGLPPGSDVDAFEFAWVSEPAIGAEAFGMLFSVDDDDPATAADESGGLDPTAVYISFLDGTSTVYVEPLGEDVDAIAVYCRGVLPEPRGACCVAADLDGDGADESASCFDNLTLSDCDTLGGAFQGSGVFCADADCGACCLPNNTCAVTGSAACNALGGTAFTTGAGCEPNPCAPVGACCFGCDDVDGDGDLETVACLDLSDADCAAIDGQWRGAGTACADTPAPCRCPGDANGDGVTDVSDFFIVAGAFGSPAATRNQGDLNCDGVVDVSDFFILAGDFGCN